MKNIRDSYKSYKKSSTNPVGINTYIELTTGFIRHLISFIFNGDEVVFPARLGTFSVLGKKQKLRIENNQIKGLSPNWVKTKELWKSSEDARNRKQLVYNTNEHSDNLRYKFIWSKKRSVVENKTLYTLTMTRANKRELSKRIKEGQEYYSTN